MILKLALRPALIGLGVWGIYQMIRRGANADRMSAIDTHTREVSPEIAKLQARAASARRIAMRALVGGGVSVVPFTITLLTEMPKAVEILVQAAVVMCASLYLMSMVRLGWVLGKLRIRDPGNPTLTLWP